LFNGASTTGIELDAKTTEMAKKNLLWFTKTSGATGRWRVTNSDSARMSEILKKGNFDCVATEPFMGPLIDSVLPETLVRKTISELEALYSSVFGELQKLMFSGQRIAFILPGIPTTNGKTIFVSENVFLKNGFVIINPAGEEIFPYTYKMENSKITRKILVLAKA
jgi:tRNA G10  N-methylase Trm11